MEKLFPKIGVFVLFALLIVISGYFFQLQTTCGNGNLEVLETCDNGSYNSITCTPSYNTQCTYCDASCNTQTMNGAYCGDGQVETEEQCDDGNRANGDGCSSDCQTENKNSENISCKLICGNLCYNEDYVKCVNGTAQTINFLEIKNSVWISESNQPKTYEVNTHAEKELAIHNDLGRKVNASIRTIFYPVALIEYGTHSMGIPQKIVFDEIMQLDVGETKPLIIEIPTNEITLSSNVQVLIAEPDSNVGISYAYYSSPFSIIDPSLPTKTCLGFKYNTKYYINNLKEDIHALCYENAFVPLGNIGCASSSDCNQMQTCVENSCFPSLSKDRSPKKINFLILTLYLHSNKEIINKNEKAIQYELDEFVSKLNDIKLNYGTPNEIKTDKVKCSASPDSIKNILENNSNENYQKLKDDLFSICKINSSQYTHIFLAAPYEGLKLQDVDLITNVIMKGIIAAALYIGDGIFVGEIPPEYINPELVTNTRLWTVILHEMTHSFGAPDLYTKNGVNGATYLWGDCNLMRVDKFEKLTPLCPLEVSYWNQE